MVAGPDVSVLDLDMTGSAMPIAAHAAKPLVLELKQASRLASKWIWQNVLPALFARLEYCGILWVCTEKIKAISENWGKLYLV